MPPKIKIADVARRAEVSVGTVSNVLNRPDGVSPRTKKRVLSAIAELGYVRNDAARHLRAGHSRTMGLVVMDITNPFFTDLARGVEDAANAAGLSVVLCNSDESAGKEAGYLDLLEEQQVRGVLITPVRRSTTRLQTLRDRGIPVVLLDHRASRRNQCSVSTDDVAGGDLAVSHLLEQGHQRIAFITGPSMIRACQERLRGARRALERAGLDPDAMPVLEGAAANVESGRDQAERLLALDPRPTAVFCANDLLALGTLQVAVRSRVAVPRSLAIIGYDDIDFAAAAAVPLSSVRQPRRELGRIAAKLLLEEAEGLSGHRHQRVEFTPTLAPRASSVPPARRRRPG